MKISCLQMDMKLGCPQENFKKAEVLIERAVNDGADILVLPETWNTGFFPKENLKQLCCNDGKEVKEVIASLADKYKVNIVAGSVSNLKDGKVYNTAYVFERNGRCVASYDKTHLFTPMGEDEFYTYGDGFCTFTLDGVKCGIIICYDLRFPELTRKLVLEGIEVLFVVSQWPKERIFHLKSLITARAIENQIFVVCCNSCGTAGSTVYGGNSAIIDPLGETLANAGETEQIITANCSFKVLDDIRKRIPVLKNRRADLY